MSNQRIPPENTPEYAEWYAKQVEHARYLDRLNRDAQAAVNAPDANGWISWGGGECPVAAGTLVDVKLRNGQHLSYRHVSDLSWDHINLQTDIIAYRLSQPAAASEPADPYADLKAAHAAGKTIQLYDVVTGVWIDIAGLPKEIAPARLRVKPGSEPAASEPASAQPVPYVFFAVGETGGEQPAATKPDPIATLAEACANDADPVTAPGVLERAAGHMRDRAATYDEPGGERSMGKAIDAFNSITGHQLDVSEGWLLLALLKLVRLQTAPGYHADSAEDGAAYLALMAEAKAREAAIDKSLANALAAYDDAAEQARKRGGGQ